MLLTVKGSLVCTLRQVKHVLELTGRLVFEDKVALFVNVTEHVRDGLRKFVLNEAHHIV